MVYGQPVSQYAHTWYNPAFMTMKELRYQAAQNLIEKYDIAMDADDYHLIWLFDIELGCMSKEAQAESND